MTVLLSQFASAQMALVGGFTAVALSLGNTGCDRAERHTTLVRVIPVSLVALTASALLTSSLVGSMLGFLAVIFIGSYVRRFGRLGLDLGVTAFLSYYLAQFAHLDTASLAAAWGAWSVAVVAQVFAHAMPLRGVRAGSCTGAPHAEHPARRTAAVSHAAQVTAAAALSILAGFAVSPTLWWWGVATSWPIFINADHPRAVVRRSSQRLAGTAIGLVVGGLLVTLTDLEAGALGVLLLFAVFGIFVADGHYGQVTFFITIALILTLELLGVSSPETLLVRMALTALGAALGVIVALAAGFWGTRRRQRPV
jgi:uncharacterized membrane protein YccC